MHNWEAGCIRVIVHTAAHNTPGSARGRAPLQRVFEERGRRDAGLVGCGRARGYNRGNSDIPGAP